MYKYNSFGEVPAWRSCIVFLAIALVYEKGKLHQKQKKVITQNCYSTETDPCCWPKAIRSKQYVSVLGQQVAAQSWNNTFDSTRTTLRPMGHFHLKQISLT